MSHWTLPWLFSITVWSAWPGNTKPFTYCMQMQECIHSHSLPPLGNTDRNLIHVHPQYTPKVQRQRATRCYIRRRSSEAEDAPEDFFGTTGVSILQSPRVKDINGLTQLGGLLKFCMDQWWPLLKLHCYPKNKNWVMRAVKAYLNKKKAVFRRGDKEAPLLEMKCWSYITKLCEPVPQNCVD